MSKRFLISVATAALILGTGAVCAQSPSGSPGSAGASSGAAAPSAGSSSNQPSSQGAESGRGASEGANSAQSSERPAAGGGASQRAQESSPGQKSGVSADKSDKAAGKDMKAEDRGRDGNRNAENNRERSSTTTGQAGAGAKLSGEQRSKITTVIKQQRVEPATNINFSISVGTRVPREVRFHPLPAEIISLYPDWRGYEFFLVRDEIVVVDPRTLEIVAVLDA
ncbi:MAG TPA: DUF1236 domain-containing protein [Rhodopseudomonas sp.]|uniref:DUF1236 domain-containing protein n=1 Tax=Rhodopseudomonas sp. TaxID=1078 RepID=UPI002ED8CC01